MSITFSESPLPGLETVPVRCAERAEKTPSAKSRYTSLYLSNEKVWLILADLFNRQGNRERCIYSYERALANNPLSKKALSFLGPVYRARERYREALDIFLRLYHLSEKNEGEIESEVGYAYLMLDMLGEAREWLAEAAKKKRRGPFLWYAVGVMYERFNNASLSEEALTAAVKLSPSFEYLGEAYFRLGVLHKNRGSFSTALMCFDHLAKNTPRSLAREDIVLQMAHVYEMQEKNAEALSLLKEAMGKKEYVRSKKARILKGWIHFKKREYHMCRETLIGIEGKDKGGAFTFYLMGRCCQILEDPIFAYDCYTKAVEGDRKNAIYWNSLGILYFSLSQYEDALSSFRNAISVDERFFEGWCNLGVLYSQFQETAEDALEAYERARGLRPKDAKVLSLIDECSRISLRSGAKLALLDVQPNPGKTPYFTAHAMMGYKPTSFKAER